MIQKYKMKHLLGTSAGDADALVWWDSCPTEVLEYSLFSSHNALWGGVAHREADGREYHPSILPRRLTATPLQKFEGELSHNARG